MEKSELSTAEVARLLGISRVAVFRKIKSGEIRAQKKGRNFVVDRSEIGDILGHFLSDIKKQEIEKAVSKTIKDYGKTLKLLGKE